VVVNQELIESLRFGPGTQRYIVAREIVFNSAPVDLIVARDLIFVADTIKRNGDAPFIVRGRPTPPIIHVPGTPTPEPTGKPGRNGSLGPRIDVYCRKFEGAIIQSVGGPAEHGGEGARGSDAIVACSRLPKTGTSGPKLFCEDPVPSPRGKRGGPGGVGGAGGSITLHFVTKTSDGSLQGLGGSGGEGGVGGAGGKVTQRITDENGTTTTHATGQAGDRGDQGVHGGSGNAVAATFSAISEQALWDSVKAFEAGSIALAWAQHRFKQGEYLFRTYRPEGQLSANLGLAKQEFDAVLRLLPANLPAQAEDPFDPPPAELKDLAQRLSSFVINNQNIYGMSRNLYVIPYVDNELEDISPYEALPLQFQQLLFTTLLKATDSSIFSQYLQVQIDALNQSVSSQGSLTIEEKAAEQASAAAKSAKDELIKRGNELSAKLPGLQQNADVEQQNQSDDGMIIPGVRNIKLFAVVASTILTVALPPAGAAGIIAAGVAPQLPDLLLGKGSKAEQDLEGLVSSGVALGESVAPYLKDLEGTAAGLKKYAEAFESSIKAGVDPKAALDDLKNQLKQDFGSDIAAAKRFALDFKKLRGDLLSAHAGPNSPKQTAFLEAARELATIAQQSQQAILAASQAEMAHQVAIARRVEAQRHAVALNNLKATVNQQGFVLRAATEQTLRRAQKTLSLIASFQFRLVRALDLYTLASLRGDTRFVQGTESALMRYDYGYVAPDLLADYAQSDTKDVAPANALLAALNSSFDAYQVSLDVRELRRKFRVELGGRLNGIGEPVVFTKDSAALAQFKTEGQLPFRIALDDIPFAYEAKVQNIKVRLTGVAPQGKSPTILNLLVSRPGATEHRWHPDRHLTPSNVTQWLAPGPEFSGRDALVLSQEGTDGNAAITFTGETPVNEDVDKHVSLQCFGTGVAGDWEISLLEPADLPRLSGLEKLEFIAFYGSWIISTAPLVESIVYSTAAVLPGATAMATLTLAQPPKDEPATVKLASSSPDAIKLPPAVTVPVGVKSVQFPMQVASSAAGAAVQLTAEGANQRSTEIFFPSRPIGVKEVVTLKRPDKTLGSVNGVAARNGRVFATFYDFPANGTPADQQGNGTLVVLERTGRLMAEAARIPVGNLPRSVDVYQNGAKAVACVVNGGKSSFNLSVISSNGKTTNGPAAQIAIGQGPIDVAIAPGGTTAYVSNWTANVLHAVDLAAMTQKPIPVFGKARKGPLGLALAPDGKMLFVAATFRADPATPPVNELVAIDVTTQRISALPVGPDPSQPVDVAVMFDSANKRHLVFVSLLGGATIRPGVMVFEARLEAAGPLLSPLTKDPILTAAGAKAVAVDSVRGSVYTVAGNGIDVIDVKRLALVAHIETGADPISVTVEPESGDVWVGDGKDGTVTRIAGIAGGSEGRWD
jgi:DNA-binding beta-propeller fold protein YncE